MSSWFLFSCRKYVSRIKITTNIYWFGSNPLYLEWIKRIYFRLLMIEVKVSCAHIHAAWSLVFWDKRRTFSKTEGYFILFIHAFVVKFGTRFTHFFVNRGLFFISHIMNSVLKWLNTINIILCLGNDFLVLNFIYNRLIILFRLLCFPSMQRFCF